MNLEKTIERTLRATDEDDFDPRSLGLEFEKSGDTAFNAILTKLDEPETSDAGRVRALRMLALLSRQFCVHRRPELLDLSIRLMEHRDIRVRSAALHSAIFNASGMRQIRNFSQEVSEAAVERVKEAARRAIESGVAAEHEELGRRFIATNGEMRVISEE
jgi:hypothetical protein